MKVGILGTGMVGHALANKFIELGHHVMMGARSSGNEKAQRWKQTAGELAEIGEFEQVAKIAEIVVFAVRGDVILEVAKLAGPDNLAGKIVIDVTNPLDFSNGMPPILIPELSNTTSAGEELQKLLPNSRVVKALNTVNCDVMVRPNLIPGKHDIFLCGNDQAAKHAVIEILNAFGWDNPIDLGGIRAARSTEGMMPFWLNLWQLFGHDKFNYHIVQREGGE